MKSERQYRDAALGAFIGWVGILVCLIIMVIVGCNESDNTVKQQHDLPMASNQDNIISLDTIIWEYDSIEAKREADSIDDYMRYWYEVLDTNSDGDIDDIEYNKETKVWTGTNQGEYTYEEQLSIEPDYIYYDTTETNE
jgi:hypothetical protein